MWHKSTDSLKGTDVYGTPCGATCNKEWSIKFDNIKFSQFLFATGDERKWLIAGKNQVNGYFYGIERRLIYKSSTKSTSYRAKWLNRRSGFMEDPWISLTDHDSAIGEGNLLYGENHYGRAHAKNILPSHKGANVFIRNHPGNLFF